MKFPESALAHKYIDAINPTCGLEIGGSAHNPNTFPGKKNVDFTNQVDTIYKLEEIRICGEAAPVDIVASGDAIPVPDSSQDYVVATHVLEHMPNAIGTLKEWWRVVRPGGIIYFVVPHKNAAPLDRGRMVTRAEHFRKDYETKATVDTHEIPEGHGRNGHYHVFDLYSVFDLVRVTSLIIATEAYEPDVMHEGPPLAIADYLDVCDKCPNGHAFILVVRK